MWAVLGSASLVWADGPAWVTVENGRFVQNGAPYRFVSANFWGALYVAAQDPARLGRELDVLKMSGVKNLRVMAAFEGPNTEPWRMVPAVRSAPGQWDVGLERGMDRLLVEAARRQMTVVVTLGNFWPWSGGLGQLRAWAQPGLSIPYPPPAVGGDWGRYQRFAAQFYDHAEANRFYRQGVERWVTRVNELTGVAYREDPTIFAWQLANEPRGVNATTTFNGWIDRTAGWIKQLDPRHLVSVGTEGETLDPQGAGLEVLRNHASASVDYVTAHLWVQNWGVYNPAQPATLGRALEVARRYVQRHAELAQILGKPCVLEEFGLARDGGSFSSDIRPNQRGAFFSGVFQEVERYPVYGGAGFWAWSGEARPREEGGYWQPGDPVVGDPPHEAQGWYGVYDSDVGTLRVVYAASRAFEQSRPRLK